MIEDVRSKIDEIDCAIIKLVCERKNLIHKLSQLKKLSGIPVRNVKLEIQKIKKAKSMSTDETLAEDVMRLLIAHAVMQQTQEML